MGLLFTPASPGRVAALCLVGSGGLGREVSPALSVMSEPVLGELGVAWSRTRAGAIQRAWPKALLLFGRPWLAPAGWLAEQYRLACRPQFLFLDTTLAALRDQVGLAGQRRVLLERLGGLEVPVLLVWDAQDRVVPVAHARRAAARLPDATLVVLPPAGTCRTWRTRPLQPHADRLPQCPEEPRSGSGQRLIRVFAWRPPAAQLLRRRPGQPLDRQGDLLSRVYRPEALSRRPVQLPAWAGNGVSIMAGMTVHTWAPRARSRASSCRRVMAKPRMPCLATIEALLSTPTLVPNRGRAARAPHVDAFDQLAHVHLLPGAKAGRRRA